MCILCQHHQTTARQRVSDCVGHDRAVTVGHDHGVSDWVMTTV